MLCALLVCMGCAATAQRTATIVEPALQRRVVDIRPTIPFRRPDLPPHMLDLGYGTYTCERGYLIVRHRCEPHEELVREQVVVVSEPEETPYIGGFTGAAGLPLATESSPFSANAQGWKSAVPDTGGVSGP